jgi:hypothetical protein
MSFKNAWFCSSKVRKIFMSRSLDSLKILRTFDEQNQAFLKDINESNKGESKDNITPQGKPGIIPPPETLLPWGVMLSLLSPLFDSFMSFKNASFDEQNQAFLKDINESNKGESKDNITPQGKRVSGYVF